MTDEPLTLRFDPQTVDHLGARMYSHLPNALAELIANAYDADAEHVTVGLNSDGSISVVDDGHGMSRIDVAEKYLRIGRNRRQDADGQSTESGRRRVSGKKGLGKLALFGIGKRVTVQTTRADSDLATTLELSYDEMKSAAGEYHPREERIAIAKEVHGTTVTLHDLKRKTEVDASELSVSLSRLFNYTDSSFGVTVVDAKGKSFPATADLRLESMEAEFTWSFPEDFGAQDQSLRSKRVYGAILSTKKPVRRALRGVTLYANGRLANEPEFFGVSESSYAYSYLTGHLNIDFIDEAGSDFIATDRRSLDWETETTGALRQELGQLLVRIGQEWRARRAAAKKEQAEEVLGTTTEEWVASIKSPEQHKVRDLVEGITSDDLDLSLDQQADLLGSLKGLAPHHAEFSWRHLHPEMQAASRVHYESGDYASALLEAIKRYITLAATKAGISADNAWEVMTGAFGKSGRLRILAAEIDSGQFTATAERDLQEGQKHLSMGVIVGFRNPMSHTELRDLFRSGVLTYQDCLDGLAILSHLARRLDTSVAKPQS